MDIRLQHSWMYNRLNPGRRGYTDEFRNGLDEFVSFALQQEDVTNDEIRCPCYNCKNVPFRHFEEVKLHIFQRGFKPDYWYWTRHGESDPELLREINRKNSAKEGHSSHHSRFETVVYDAVGPQHEMQCKEEMEEYPNIDEKVSVLPKITEVPCICDGFGVSHNWKRRGATVMKNNLNKVRLTRKRPSWIGPKRPTSGFKKKSIHAKTNRSSDCEGYGMSLHTCGPITTSQHRANLEKYKCRSEQASSQGTPPLKETDVLFEVAGIRKGHVYGIGSESSLFAGRRNYRGSSSSSTEWMQRHEFEQLKIEMWVQRHEFEQLKNEMKIEREEMRKEMNELRDMVRQLTDNLNFQPKPYTRDQVHEYNVANNNVVNGNDDGDVYDDNDVSDGCEDLDTK